MFGLGRKLNLNVQESNLEDCEGAAVVGGGESQAGFGDGAALVGLLEQMRGVCFITESESDSVFVFLCVCVWGRSRNTNILRYF